MSPYRTPPEPRNDDDTGEDSLRFDDRVLAGLLLVIGGIRVALAVLDHEVIGAESTLALIAVVFGLVLLVWRR